MSEPDPLSASAAELDTLADRPVSAHPDVLDALHRAVVEELDDLSSG